jgi:hypothetical protein
MRRLITITLAAALLAACSSSGDNRAETAPTSTTVTTTAPTTTEAPTTTTEPTGSELGETKTLNGDDGTYQTKVRITVLDYSDNATLPADRKEFAPRPGYKYVAIQVRWCLVSTNYPDDIAVSWEPWSLNGNDGTTIEPAGDYYPDTLIQPLYPQDKVTPVGTCRKGWIPFAVPNKWKPDYVEYAPEDGRLTWRL